MEDGLNLQNGHDTKDRSPSEATIEIAQKRLALVVFYQIQNKLENALIKLRRDNSDLVEGSITGIYKNITELNLPDNVKNKIDVLRFIKNNLKMELYNRNGLLEELEEVISETYPEYKEINI